MQKKEIMAKLAELAKQQKELEKKLYDSGALFIRKTGPGTDIGVLSKDSEDGGICMATCYYEAGEFGYDMETYDDYNDIIDDDWKECSYEEVITALTEAFDEFVSYHSDH